MRLGYQVCAKRTACIAVSNLGRIALPVELTRYVEDVFCTPDANPKSPCSCAVLSYGVLHVGLCCCMTEDRAIRTFDEEMNRAIAVIIS